MALVPIFHGRVTEQGELVLFATERTQRRAHLRSLAGRDVELVVRKKRTQRSLDQNAYLHAGPFPVLAEELGYESIEDLKLALMGEKWGYRLDPISGREFPIKPHTSSMTVDECSEFIEWLVVWSQTVHNIRVPLPGESEAA